MDYLRQIEEDLRNIGIESKVNKKYPEVSDASERALDALKSIREVYVSDIMRKNKSAKLPQSSDILAPYLLVCNYADGSSKVTLMALNGINLLLMYDLVPPSDVKNILRVLNIQGSSKSNDIQLKVLQVVLQLANSLNQNAATAEYLTESTFCAFLTLAMQLCDASSKNNVLSVSSTALGTARQIVAQVMDGALALFPRLGDPSAPTESGVVEVTVDQASSKYSLTAIMLVREMCLFVQNMPGDWIRGVTMPQAFALDLLTEILSDSKLLFQKVPFFKKLIQDSVFPAIKHLLKCLQEDYLRHAQQSGTAVAASFTSKVVKLARCILLNFVVYAARSSSSNADSGTGTGESSNHLNAEGVFIVSMLVHSLQPDRAGPGHSGSSGGGSTAGAHLPGMGDETNAAAGSNNNVPAESSFKSRWEEASSFLGTNILSRFSAPTTTAASTSSGGNASSGSRSSNSKGIGGAGGGSGGLGNGFYVTLPSSPNGPGAALPFNSSSASALLNAGHGWLGGNSGATQLPTFPALCCLEALLAFLLSDLTALLASDASLSASAASTRTTATMTSPSKFGGGGDHSHSSPAPKLGSSLHLFETLLISTMLGVSTFLQSAMVSEANLRELEGSLRLSTPLSKLLKSLISGSYDQDGSTASGPAAEGLVNTEKQMKSIHELLHGAPSGATAPGDLLLFAFCLTQFIPRMLLTVSMQVCACSENGQKMLRRSNSSGSNTSHRVFLSSGVVGLIASPATLSASSGLKGLVGGTAVGTSSLSLAQLLRGDLHRAQVLRDSVGRVCDSVYESSLDTSSLLLNASGDATVVRSSLGIIAELAIVTGIMDMPKQCDIVTSVLCKFTVPMWHGHEMMLSAGQGNGGENNASGGDNDTAGGSSPRGGAKRESLIKWRHFQAFVRLSQVIHLIADAISDWDNIVDSFEQLVDYFICSRNFAQQSGSNSAPLSPSPSHFSDKDLSFPEIEKLFGSIERFKAYSVFLSDDALVRLMTSLVALSMNHLAVSVSSSHMSTGNLDEVSSPAEGAHNSDIIQVPNSPFVPRAGSPGSSSVGGGGNKAGSGTASGAGGISRVRPDSSSAGLVYMSEGIRNGTISFSLQALIEITKLNAFRISTIWQMVISHLRMIASLKSANSRAISVAATHDVILSSMRYMQQGTKPSAGLTFVKEDLTQATTAASMSAESGAARSLVMSDELLLNFVLPSFETVFIGRDIHRSTLEGRDERLSNRPALSQNDLLSSLKALSSVRYSDVRSAIIDGLAHLLQGKGQIVTGGGTGGWAVILDLISSVPLSMVAPPASSSSVVAAASESEQQAWTNATASTDEAWDVEESFGGLEVAEAQSTLPPQPPTTDSPSAVRLALQQPNFQAGSGSMASLATASVIPQYQWPQESLVSAFTCMKLIVDEFLVVLEPDCELLSSVLHGLALFGSQVKDVNISLTGVEMLWKVTDDAIKYARSNQNLRLSGKIITTSHYVAVVFDIMLKQLFQLSMDGQPLIRHCAMNTLFSAMSTHAPIISAEQWQQVFGNIIFPLFERAGARSRIAMKSKEEAIAPELKKGVKMSVHHSRDTAHKQWSETRVIALRGLSRVLRTCTRLLLQESWFRVIWADALNVCQGALQAANEEQEVSIAALDVVFTMLRVIIQMDSTGPATAAATPAAVDGTTSAPVIAKGASKNAATAASANPALSKDEVENIEKCKLTLWQLTWTAVRTTAFFTCNSVELALAICQKLKELYKSRIDHEFRYSDNVRVLLEILVALVRPRVGLLRGNSAALTCSGNALPDLITQKQDRVAESQLQRAVMDLLTVIQPTDGLAQSCLLSTLTEICFSVLWVQVQVTLPGSESESGKAGAEVEWLVLGAAPERLRKEAADLLAQLLLIQFPVLEVPPSVGDVTNPQQHDAVVLSKGPGPVSKVFPWATASAQLNALMVDIVVRRFVADICEGPLLARCQSHLETEPTAVVATVESVTKKDKKKKSNSSDRDEGFFASFGSIMSSFSSPSSQNLQPVYATQQQGAAASSSATGSTHLPHLQSARIAGGTLHKFVKYTAVVVGEVTSLPDCTPVALCLGRQADSTALNVKTQWRTFYFADTEIKLLLTAVQSCYTLMSSPVLESSAAVSTGQQHNKQATSPGGAVRRNIAPASEVLTEPIWNSLLTATACLLSPWKSSELCSKAASTSGPHAIGTVGQQKSVANALSAEPSRLPAADIACILQVTLKIVDFMRYPAAMCVQWVDILVRSTLLGMHVLAQSSSTSTSGDEAAMVGDFYLTLWQQVVSVLGSLLSAEDDADLTVRSRALWGVVAIARGALRAVTFVAARRDPEATIIPSALISIGEEALQLFMKVSTTAELVSSAGAAAAAAGTSNSNSNTSSSSNAEEDSLISEWMLSTKTQPFASPAATKIASGNNSNSGSTTATATASATKRRSIPGNSDGKPTGSQDNQHLQGMNPTASEVPQGSDDSSSCKGHLVMLLPMCLDLALTPCDAPELKQVAVALVRAVDLNKLTSSVQVLETENAQLRTKNRQLEKEIIRLQSANTLPF